MVASGVAMAGLALLILVLAIRKRQLPTARPVLWAVVLASPLGFVAMEAGWLVTEWGRQPWMVRGFMRTAEALTPFRPLGPPFLTFTAVYLLLGAVVAYLLYRQVRGPASDGQTCRRLSWSWPPRWWRRWSSISCSAAPISAAASGTCWPRGPARPPSARPSSGRSARSGRRTTSG